MRRLAVGCTTDAHQLYPTFMARISACIFEWDAADVNKLREAKRAQLKEQGLMALTEKQLDRHIKKEELELHCRRRTRGEDQTIRLLDQLISELISDKGKDALGVPLLDPIRMQHIWRVQKRHVKCIQDPPGVALYTQTGTITKGGVQLQTLRCARGSTSLESFHCHLNRFIPGNSANSLNFQIYLLDGLHRWNHNRAAAALEAETSGLRTYSGELVHSVNKDYEKVFGRKLIPSFTPPSKYTGELIGVQSLLRQNNEPLQCMAPDSEEANTLLEQLEEPVETDEGFEELEHIEAVDEQSLAGMDRVDELAEYLVELRNEKGLTLTNQQASTIVGLWQNLEQHDKDRISYAARHQERLLTANWSWIFINFHREITFKRLAGKDDLYGRKR
ncbi:uncharacterized protein LOC130100892 [Rhinichthys klamathensis goyatoka]|uniref:uncharacterized protein LOC130100892 n=1 Tax=Rhinichthys klamathensis goyatoka TaxID=3034132 RepID=UPI0024B49A67|nr:uncharacterized protein LOC130100892 [Rhinichthys klamathensis goyatoka]